ncbi:laminin subunit alpha-2-like [Hetaerina americana]|uniref:laminin subunit alpha-2-like n=1 Tax=Hetaerina americana TaxID=62018 RepID=UPI003A7F2C46
MCSRSGGGVGGPVNLPTGSSSASPPSQESDVRILSAPSKVSLVPFLVLLAALCLLPSCRPVPHGRPVGPFFPSSASSVAAAASSPCSLALLTLRVLLVVVINLPGSGLLYQAARSQRGCYYVPCAPTAVFIPYGPSVVYPPRGGGGGVFVPAAPRRRVSRPPPAPTTTKRPAPPWPRASPKYTKDYESWMGLKYGCGCHKNGSDSPACDIVSGQCLCKPNVAGRACDQCRPGYWGLSSGRGCRKCSCDTLGSSSGGGSVRVECDPETGRCACKPGVGGSTCNRCLPGFYGFSEQGCKPCEPCNRDGHVCDPVSGRCVCPPLSEGERCQICMPGSWKDPNSSEPGCKLCECDPSGMLRIQCHPTTGRCVCRRGFGGPKCAECAYGFYGFPDCRPCNCDLGGTDPRTCNFNANIPKKKGSGRDGGRHYYREGEKDAEGIERGDMPLDDYDEEGYDIGDYNKGSECACDQDTGRCQCKPYTLGRTCNQCKEGTFGVSRDIPNGCLECFCFGRSTSCTEATVSWSQIVMPYSRTVYIEYDSPDPQFRPGGQVSPVNTQEICYINFAVPGEEYDPSKTHEGRNARKQTGLRLDLVNNLQMIPGDAGDVRIGVSYLFDTPIYWQLPKPFLGDKILSYGGYLRFAVEAQGGNTLLPNSVAESYPLVQLQGNLRLVLEHYPVSRPTPSVHYQVKLHESEWRLKNHPQVKVTRELMMLALQNIQHILIRATDSVDFDKIILRDVSLDAAVESPFLSKEDQKWLTTHRNDQRYIRRNSTWQSHLPPAHGVELCECPSEYGASSCQDPSIGFYRWRSPWPDDDDIVAESVVIIISRLAGEARPCRCNGRSSVCDRETGYCLNCTDYTGGVSCETCAPGHYGDPTRGIRCQPCPCPGPGPERNFAESCTVVPGRSVTCRCRRGYTGTRCDRCSYGFFGWPGRTIGMSGEVQPEHGVKYGNEIVGTCEPCNCHPIGSVSDECHERTGECNCRPGVTGRDCSQCKEPGTVLSAGPPPGCLSCMDNCTGPLLTYASEIGRTITSASSQFTGATPAPWGRLSGVETESHDLKAKLDASREAAKKGISGEGDITILKERAHFTVTKAKEILVTASQAAETGNFVWREVTKEERDATNAQKMIRDVVSDLRRYGGEGSQNSQVGSMEAALNEARRLLYQIRSKGHQSSSTSVAANEALRTAEDLLRRLKNYSMDRTRTHRLRDSLETWTVRLQDLDELIGKVASTLEKEKELTQENTAALERVKGRLSQFVDEQEAIAMAADEAAKYNRDGELALRLSENSLHHLEKLQYQLGNLTEKAEQKESLLARLNPLYEEKYVRAAQHHADKLMERAEEYRDRFNATREVASYALQAAQAYRKIVEALESAKEASQNATVASKIAFSKAYSPFDDGTGSLLEKALDARGDSEGLLEEAAGGKELVKGLKRRLEKGKGEVSSLQKVVQTAVDAEKKFRMEVERLEREMASRTPPEVNTMREDLDKLLEKVNALSSNATKALRPEVEQLKSNADLQIQTALAEAHVDNAWDDLREARVLLEKREREAREEREKNSSEDKKNDTLAEGLQLLRDRIAQARHAAYAIHLSLSGPGKGPRCVRSYRPGLEPSTTSSMLITFAMSGQEKDSLLLYMPSATGQDFMALEVVDRKVRFSWDVGGGVGEVYHPLHIRTARDLGEDKHWYRIEVERTGNVARLWVRPQVLPEGSPHLDAPPASNATAPGYGRIDFLASDQVWVGGWGWEESQGSRHGRKMSPHPTVSAPAILYPSSDKPNALKAQRFVGCLHQVVIDGKPLGLWNFMAESPGSACSACIEGAEEIRDESAYSFSGDGSYAVLLHDSRSPYNKYVFSVSFAMRSFDEDAILFLAISRNKDRYISIVLRKGRVVFRIGYGGDSRLELSTEGRYNNGEWIRVEASRAYDRKRRLEKGLLKVGGESRDGAPSPPPSGPDALPDLSGGEYYIGGTPPGFSLPSMGPLGDWGIMGGVLEGKGSHAHPFRGCLSDLQVVQEGYNPLRGQFYGVEASCPNKPARVVSFYGNGYLEMDSHVLKKKASLGFVFRSPQPNALLLLSTFDAYPKQSPGTEGGSSKDDYDEEMTNLVGPGDSDMDLVSSESSKQNRSFYSVSLDGGRVEARVEAGRGEVRLRSEARYDDNHNHAVTMIKTGRRVELRVDDRTVSSATLPEGASQVRAPESGGLFLGGLPPVEVNWNSSIALAGMAPNFHPLIGAIQDFIFNDELLRFDKPVAFLNVGIGRNEGPGIFPSSGHLSTHHQPVVNDRGKPYGGSTGPGEIFHSGMGRRDGTERGCKKVERYSLEPGAVKLGDKPGSHIRYLHRKRSSILLQRNFSLGITFRTHYPGGLIFMVPGGGVSPGSKKRHSSFLTLVKPQRQTFLMVSLKNSQVHVFVHGKKKHETTLPGVFNDGSWHNVTLRKEDRKLWLSVDKNKPSRMKVPKRLGGGGAGSMGAGDIYIGGIPNADSPSGDTWLASLPENLRTQVSRVENFKGCVRDLTVDNIPRDLVGERATPHRVGQCFPIIETGSYFPGDAYAVYKTNFHVGSLLELELEFRTSELTGVLLSVSEPIGSPALSLELHNGKVLMSGDMGDGHPFRVEQGLPASSPMQLCDGQWHKVKARYVNNELTLRVDHQDVQYGLSGNGNLTETNTDSPLYIGGLPDNASSGTLLSRDNFKGCIRNMMIGGEKRDWTDMASLTNVLLSSCPVHN